MCRQCSILIRLMMFFSLFKYEENGFLVVKDILTEDEKKELTQATDELIEM